MSQTPVTADRLTSDLQLSLVQFAKACRAAARSVSLYPPAHPAIKLGLDHLVSVSSAVTREGPFKLTILPDGLLLNGAAPARMDTGIAELASLLYRQAVGQLVLHGGSDADSWRALLLLLARSPEELRADGGIGSLWRRAGGPSIEIEQIDFGEVLREHAGGEHGDLLTILRHCMRSGVSSSTPAPEVDDFAHLAESPAELRALVRDRVIDRSRTGGGGFLDLARGLIAQVARESPDRLEAMLDSLSQMAGNLPADVMIDLLKQRGTAAAQIDDPGGTGGPPLDVAGAIADRMPDATLADFVANSVAAEGGATSALAAAFQELVSEPERQDRVLGLAGDRLSETTSARDVSEPPLEPLWDQARAMLTAAPSQQYVSEAYARELQHARTRAVDVEDAQTDPPDRIGRWMDTVSDRSLRTLDVQLLLDLLRIEAAPVRWATVLGTALLYIDDLVRVNQLEAATDLTEAIAGAADEMGDPEKRPLALDALGQLASGTIVKHIVTFVRSADQHNTFVARRLCLAIGPRIIGQLVQPLITEQDPKHRRRLQDVIVAFGGEGREIVQGLVGNEDADVRRTAVYLLREFGSGGTLPNLEPLLTDPEPRVQREAIRTIALAGDDRAYGMLAHALQSGAGSRQVQAEELAALGDERAAPLFHYLVQHLDSRAAPLGVYLLCLHALGRFGGHDAVTVLQRALAAGLWWQPFRTAAVRSASADALRAIGSPAAFEVLRTAARSSGSVRRAARRALAK